MIVISTKQLPGQQEAGTLVDLKPADRHPTLCLRRGDHKTEDISQHMSIQGCDYTVILDPMNLSKLRQQRFARLSLHRRQA